MKKAWIWISVIVILLLAAVGGMVGYRIGYLKSHIFVEDAVYEKDLTYLDLRGTGVSLEHYETVRSQLPDCVIRYDVPFQGGFYPDDTKELTVSSLTEAEIVLLDYLPRLQEVYAHACEDYAQLLALQERRPDCRVHYTVTIGGTAYTEDTAELSFGKEQPDLQELRQALTWLPNMETIHFDQPEIPVAELLDLRASFPDIRFTWTKDAFGVTYSSDVTEIDLSNMYFTSLDEVEEALVWFPSLEKVIMCWCGYGEKDLFDNETMSAFREKMRDQYKVVWALKINYVTVRTDDTWFMPAKTGQVVTNYQVQNLKYCEDMVCVDLGHMAITDISFVEYMPHLKYFIVIDSPLIYIDPISSCKELIYLELFWNQISDFTPLLGCTALQDLNISRNHGDPLVFKDMPWLKNLWIDGFDIRPSERPILEEALPDTYIKYCDGEMTANGWRDLQNYFDMRDYLGMPYNRW